MQPRKAANVFELSGFHFKVQARAETGSKNMVSSIDFRSQTFDPKAHRGFTLIELMIVVAIIAIILTLALPTYTDYSIRAKVGEALSVAAAAKTAVANACNENPTIPLVTESNAGYSFTTATEYIADITLSGPCVQPVISVQTQNTGATPDPIVYLTGYVGDGRMVFVCATSGQFQHVPRDCRNSIP